MALRIPAPLKREHEELHQALGRVERRPGAVGEAARRLARIMHPHFLREDEYAVPPLGLLRSLSGGHVTPVMGEVLPLVARLKEEMPLMLEEHRAIKGAVQELGRTAEAEGDEEAIALTRELLLHAQLEEEVLYPAAIVVGEYVKLKLEGAGHVSGSAGSGR